MGLERRQSLRYRDTSNTVRIAASGQPLMFGNGVAGISSTGVDSERLYTLGSSGARLYGWDIRRRRKLPLRLHRHQCLETNSTRPAEFARKIRI